MTDAETTAAIEALAHRLRNNRDEDPDVFALEFITALRGHGWRPTPAKAVPPPAHAPAGTATAPRDETLRELRADMEARAAAAREAKEAGAA